MRAYYFDNETTDQRLPHDYDPSRPVDVETLKKIGVLYWEVPVEGYQSEVRLLHISPFAPSDYRNLTGSSDRRHRNGTGLQKP